MIGRSVWWIAPYLAAAMACSQQESRPPAPATETTPKAAVPPANAQQAARALEVVRAEAFQSARTSSSQCDAVLLPQLEISNSTTQQKVAWLSIITRENYAATQAGGGIKLILFDLPIGASYDQFSEARERYYQQQQLKYSIDEARSLLRQTLSAAQIEGWVKCIQTRAAGVRILLSKDSPDNVAATVYFDAGPEERVRFTAELDNGTVGGKTQRKFKLQSGGSESFVIARTQKDKPTYIFVNGASMSDVAVSFPKTADPPPPRCINPMLLSRGAATTASANNGSAGSVTDGSLSGIWNAGAHAPQWIEIDLGSPLQVHHLKLIPEQTPPGYTEHRLTGTRADGSGSVLGELNVPTISGGEYVVLVSHEAGLQIKRVRVETVRSPSWIAWREVEVYGCRGASPERLRAGDR
jgi:hypothetical protein